MSGEDCKHIWPLLEKILSPHISRLSQNIVDHSSAFLLLVYSFVQIKIEKDRFKSMVQPDTIVEGCGVPEINGVYRRDGLWDNASKYSRSVYYNGKIEEFSLFRFLCTFTTR